jgi:hypothetical protein
MHSLKARSNYFTKLVVLFLSGILAHTLSGGAIIELQSFISLTALISLILFLTRNLTLEGPQLALVVLALQSAGHFLLGGADKSSDIQMSGAHLISGVLSYRAVTHFDHFWEFFAELTQALVVPIFEILTFRIEVPSFHWIGRKSPISSDYFSSIQTRGPPIKEFS